MGNWAGVCLQYANKFQIKSGEKSINTHPANGDEKKTQFLFIITITSNKILGKKKKPQESSHCSIAVIFDLSFESKPKK